MTLRSSILKLLENRQKGMTALEILKALYPTSVRRVEKMLAQLEEEGSVELSDDRYRRTDAPAVYVKKQENRMAKASGQRRMASNFLAGKIVSFVKQAPHASEDDVLEHFSPEYRKQYVRNVVKSLKDEGLIEIA